MYVITVYLKMSTSWTTMRFPSMNGLTEMRLIV